MKLGRIVLVLGGLALVGAVAPHFDRETYVARITKRERIVEGTGENVSSKYLVFTELVGGKVRVFENTDSPLELKWNSSDIYGTLVEGKTYSLRTYGWRIPFLSAYENILSAEEVK